MHIKNDKINEEEIFEISINAGAKDCISSNGIYEIVTEKEDFYKIKNVLEKKVDSFIYSAIEWRPLDNLMINKEQREKLIEIVNALEELDDVQNIFTNANLQNLST